MPADDKDPSPSPPSSGAPHDEPDEAQSAKGGGDSTLPAEIEELLDQLPEEAQQKIDRLVSLTAYSHKGPIPSPADFAEYDRVRAGTADDIIQMSKDEQGINYTYIPTADRAGAANLLFCVTRRRRISLKKSWIY